MKYNGVDYNDYLIEQAIDSLTDQEWEDLINVNKNNKK